jgi:hypothetical protein
MAQASQTLPDITPDNLAFQKALLEAEGFDVQVREQGDGRVTLVATMEIGDAATTTGKDGDDVPTLIANGSSVESLAQAQQTARAALPGFPHNGCAANLSALLRQSGIPVPMTLGAGTLAGALKARGWQKIDVGSQTPGDVGVTLDNTEPPGADHIYLVLQSLDADEMLIADNQETVPHNRRASGHRADGEERGTTATEYFLRAPT